jgi:hypothetical protein
MRTCHTRSGEASSDRPEPFLRAPDRSEIGVQQRFAGPGHRHLAQLAHRRPGQAVEGPRGGRWLPEHVRPGRLLEDAPDLVGPPLFDSDLG